MRSRAPSLGRWARYVLLAFQQCVRSLNCHAWIVGVSNVVYISKAMRVYIPAWRLWLQMNSCWNTVAPVTPHQVIILMCAFTAILNEEMALSEMLLGKAGY